MSNNNEYINFEDFQKESFLNNEELKKVYDDLESKYGVIRNFIKLRNELHITQKELESLSGIKQESISRFESGNLKNISIGYLTKLLKPLGYKVTINFEKV